MECAALNAEPGEQHGKRCRPTSRRMGTILAPVVATTTLTEGEAPSATTTLKQRSYTLHEQQIWMTNR